MASENDLTSTIVSVGLMRIVVSGDPVAILARSDTGTAITFTPTTTGAVNTVTVMPIIPFTLNPQQLAVSSDQPQNPSVIMPSSLTPSDGSIVFTCTNSLTSGDSPFTASFTVTLGADAITDFLALVQLPIALSIAHDPTMVFNPPDGG